MTSPDELDAPPSQSALFLSPSQKTGASTGTPLRSLSSPSDDPSPDPSPTPPSSDPHDAYVWDDETADASPSAPRSTADPDAPKSRRGKRLKALREPFRAAVVTAGGIVNQFLSRPGEQTAGVWLPDEEDVKGIADPLASIASRRAPSGIDNPDVTDGLSVAAALLSYVVKSLAARSQLDLAHAHYEGPDAGADLPDVGTGAGPSAPAQPDADAPLSAGLSWLRRRAGHDAGSDVDQLDAGDYDGRGAE